MSTIFDYLDWRGDLSFDDSPFNDIDAAILARFSYEPFEGIVDKSFRKTIKLEDVCMRLLNKIELESSVIDIRYDIEFIQKMLNSRRFNQLKLSGFVNEIDIQRQTQFSAVVYDMNEGNYYLAYRGTDSTIIGWKEDFNMGFEFPVPAQELALDYFKRAIMSIKEGSFIIGGHSKGGNLSIYSSAFCDRAFQNRILSIYNFDGPGFTETIMQKDEFKLVADRIKTFIPQFSVVGMLLEHVEEYSVVKSNATGIDQHDVLTWELTRDGFVTQDKLDAGSRFIDTTLTNWLSKLPKDDREQFIDTLYQVLTGGNAKTLQELSDNKFDNAIAAVRSYAGLEADNKKSVKDALNQLVRSAGNALKK